MLIIRNLEGLVVRQLWYDWTEKRTAAKVDRWMDDLKFYVLFQKCYSHIRSLEDDIMKCLVQWNLVLFISYGNRNRDASSAGQCLTY